MSYGFSLLELLIALFIGTLLIFGAMEIYLSLKLSYRTYYEDLQNDQEARLMILLINRHVRLAGFKGCIDTEKPVDMRNAIKGYTASTIPAQYGIRAKPNSDILILHECIHYQKKWQFLAEAFFIAKTGRRDKNGKALLALYDKKIPGKAEELSEKINNLKIQYGISDPTHSQIMYYKTANEISDWSQVRSIDYTLNNHIHFYVALREGK